MGEGKWDKKITKELRGLIPNYSDSVLLVEEYELVNVFAPGSKKI